MSTRGSKNRDMVLNFIGEYQEKNMRPPTIREMQEHCAFKSPRAVSYILEVLEKASLIKRRPHSRGVYLSNPRDTGLQIPIFAAIPAGSPTLIEENPETLHLSAIATFGISSLNKAFSMQITDDDLRAAGILTGDTVILEQKSAKFGDIVVVLDDGVRTLKRYIPAKDTELLKAAYPCITENEKASIKGVVVSVLRKL